jgi:hypothetical protein
MPFNISIKININFHKIKYFFHHFIFMIACSKHIVASTSFVIIFLHSKIIHSVNTRNPPFGNGQVLQTSPQCMDKRNIYIFTYHARTPHFTRDVPLEWSVPVFWPTFGFIVYPSTTPCFGNANSPWPLNPKPTMISS